MKNIIILFLVGCISFVESFAEVNLSKVWQASNENTIASKCTLEKSPITVDRDGNVYVTGTFDKDFKLGDCELKANGTSAYLAKYDRRGNVKWAVALTGSATITHLVLADDGLIYVAGQFAGEVICGSTKDDSSWWPPITGSVWGDDYSKCQSSSFVLAYTENGAAEWQLCYTATPIYFLTESDGYFPNEDDIFFKIEDISIKDSVLIIAATHAGTLYCNGRRIYEGDFERQGDTIIDVEKHSICSDYIYGGSIDVLANFYYSHSNLLKTNHLGSISLNGKKEVFYAAYSGLGNIHVDTPIKIVDVDKQGWKIIECNSDIRMDPDATENEKLNNGSDALIDGTTSKWWRSIYRYPQDLPYYAVIDFGKEQTIDNFSFVIPSSSNKRYSNSKSGHLEISNDNVNWDYLCSWQSPSAATQYVSVDFEKVRTRYLKFVIDKVFKNAISGNINNPNATAIGELSVGSSIGGDQRILSQESDRSSLILSCIKDYDIEQFEAVTDEEGYFMTPCRFLNFGDRLYIIGYETNQQDCKLADSFLARIFVIKADKNNLSDHEKLTFEVTDDNISYHDITSAVMTDEGEIFITANGRYTSQNEDSGKIELGDFAKKTKSFILLEDSLIPIALDNPIGVDIAGPYLAVSHFSETGNDYSLYRMSITGIEDIKIESDKKVTYYNIQGIKVENPGTGLYIIRRGNIISKEFIIN